MIKHILALVYFLLSPFVIWAANCDGAGNCYIRAGATGTGDGSNWTNACSGFTGVCAPSSMSRNVTYWVANGNYGDVNFSTPDSGTQLINVKAAVVANHGTSTGWQNAFAGQALFLGNGSTISSDYWTFDGNGWNGCAGQAVCGPNSSNYNMVFQLNPLASNQSTSIITFNGNLSNITFTYVDLEGTNLGNGSSSAVGDTGLAGSPVSNLWVNHSLIARTGNSQLAINGGVSQTFLWEYNYVYKNHTCCNASHDEAFSLLASNVIIRYNYFLDITSTGVITDASANGAVMSNWDIYGNIFDWDGACGVGGCFISDGVIAMLGENMSGTFNVYNNTMANLPINTTGNGLWGHRPGGTITINAYDNLTGNNNGQGLPLDSNCHDNNDCHCSPASNCVSFHGTLNWDYQTYSAGDTNSADTSAHKQTTASNLWVNSLAHTVAGFELTADTAAGLSLSSPYNKDMLTVTRGANGTWDHGALQISGTHTVNPPQNLRVTSVQ